MTSLGLVLSPRSLAEISKYDIAPREIEECFINRTGPLLTATDERVETEPPSHWFIARTALGRELKVVFVYAGDVVQVRSAYPPTAADQRIYTDISAAHSQIDPGPLPVGDVEPAVGPLRAGVVISIDHEVGVGYVQEDATGRRFGVSRAFIKSGVFDSLNWGDRVYFRENGRNSAAVVLRAE